MRTRCFEGSVNIYVYVRYHKHPEVFIGIRTDGATKSLTVIITLFIA